MDVDKFTRVGRVRASYDAVAPAYANEITPVDSKPFEIGIISRFLESLLEGEVLDLGCGPGDVTRLVRRKRAFVTGIDLSSAMITQARQADPGGNYEVHDMSALDRNGTVAGIIAFYSLIHFGPTEFESTLAGWRAALKPGGRVLIAVHAGDAPVHLNEFLGHPVDLDFHLFQPSELQTSFQRSGFESVSTEQREPYPAIEAPTRRIYVTARKPDNPHTREAPRAR